MTRNSIRQDLINEIKRNGNPVIGFRTWAECAEAKMVGIAAIRSGYGYNEWFVINGDFVYFLNYDSTYTGHWTPDGAYINGHIARLTNTLRQELIRMVEIESNKRINNNLHKAKQALTVTPIYIDNNPE
ncbi:hypothetical protein FQP88_23530 [Vibrio atlanticus]|nr:hypothetical protein FQP88_23530 [Vibrio atlanticus]